MDVEQPGIPECILGFDKHQIILTPLTSWRGGGAFSGPWRTWMIPLDARMSDSVIKRSLM